jgi:YidC/Oxa1 family membrane protein insertase
MDKNTVIGLSLIGVLLVAFTYLSQPSKEEIAQKQKKELAAKKRKEAEKKETVKQTATATDTTKNATTGTPPIETPAEPVQVVKEEIITLESDKLIVNISTKGGNVASVQLKEYESFNDFADKKAKVNKPLYLFKKGDQTNELAFKLNGATYKTGNKQFEVVSKSSTKVVLSHKVGDGTITYTYAVTKGYDVDFDVALKGLSQEVQPKSVMLNWNMAMHKTERMLSEQRKVSTICFQNADGKLDWNSEVANDQSIAEQNINWVAYKQSYFSSILEPEDGFAKKGTKLTVRNFKEGEPQFHANIRDYKSTLNLGLNSTENGSVSFNWYFGPNDYKTLIAYDKGYDDILNWGWGIFRWINIYAVQPIFDFFVSHGIGAGIAILLLTLILKLVLMPVQWKMFVSSAKMRILKPDIDAINAKYPNKEDAMKKQMDMMALYRESGASPLAGCVPMLFQMPILLAVFRFFPASFELRQKGFLWAEDLSSYDSVWDFGTYLPLYGNHMSLFTLLMAGTTLAYTYLNSQNVAQQQQPGMPNMKVIMYIFPFMMIFFFNNFSSGLSYYYFISTLMTILLMFAIKTFFVDEEKLKAKMAAVRVTKGEKAKSGKKKSSFMQRLDDMQRAQQEQLRNKKK